MKLRIESKPFDSYMSPAKGTGGSGNGGGGGGCCCCCFVILFLP